MTGQEQQAAKTTAFVLQNSDVSPPFAKPKSWHFAVKVANHLGDEELKVFSVAAGS